MVKGKKELVNKLGKKMLGNKAKKPSAAAMAYMKNMGSK